MSSSDSEIDSESEIDNLRKAGENHLKHLWAIENALGIGHSSEQATLNVKEEEKLRSKIDEEAIKNLVRRERLAAAGLNRFKILVEKDRKVIARKAKSASLEQSCLPFASERMSVVVRPKLLIRVPGDTIIGVPCAFTRHLRNPYTSAFASSSATTSVKETIKTLGGVSPGLAETDVWLMLTDEGNVCVWSPQPGFGANGGLMNRGKTEDPFYLATLDGSTQKDTRSTRVGIANRKAYGSFLGLQFDGFKELDPSGELDWPDDSGSENGKNEDEQAFVTHGKNYSNKIIACACFCGPGIVRRARKPEKTVESDVEDDEERLNDATARGDKRAEECGLEITHTLFIVGQRTGRLSRHSVTCRPRSTIRSDWSSTNIDFLDEGFIRCSTDAIRREPVFRTSPLAEHPQLRPAASCAALASKGIVIVGSGRGAAVAGLSILFAQTSSKIIVR